MSRTTITCGLLLLSSALSACAFFGKSAPLEPRYYSAESSAAQRAATPAPSTLSLRLGRVLSGAHLQERIAYRNGERELGFYEERRWTERPEVYVRRALAQALFEQRGLQRVVSGPAPVLEIELLEFVELRSPKHAARVRITASLSDGRTVRLERTFTSEQAVNASEFADVAEAMASALQHCAEELADAVVSELNRQASAPSSSDALPPGDAGQTPMR